MEKSQIPMVQRYREALKEAKAHQENQLTQAKTKHKFDSKTDSNDSKQQLTTPNDSEQPVRKNKARKPTREAPQPAI